MAGDRKRVAVIGAGIVGIATASWLVRDGHNVTVIDPEPPGSGASFGNAGCFNPSSVVPVASPGMLSKVPGYLADPLGPLRIRWSYLPALTPWLARLIRAGTPARIEAQARALTPLLAPCLETVMELAYHAGAKSLVARNGILIAYRTQAALGKDDQRAWDLRRRNGITWEELDADELRQFDPNPSRDYTSGASSSPATGTASIPAASLPCWPRRCSATAATCCAAVPTGFVLDGTGLLAVRTPRRGMFGPTQR